MNRSIIIIALLAAALSACTNDASKTAEVRTFPPGFWNDISEETMGELTFDVGYFLDNEQISQDRFTLTKDTAMCLQCPQEGLTHAEVRCGARSPGSLEFKANMSGPTKAFRQYHGTIENGAIDGQVIVGLAGEEGKTYSFSGKVVQ